MNYRIPALTLLASGLALCMAAPASAQNTNAASILVRMTVETGIDIQGMNDLDFGPILPGATKIVAFEDPGAGQFVISGAGGAEVSIEFTSLPGVVGIPVVLSTDSLPVSYVAGYNQIPDPGSATDWSSFLPLPPTPLPVLSPTGELYIYLGGSITADPLQVPGNYEGVATLEVSYTGNED